MLRTRVIPCLLLQGSSLVKTINFKKPNYIGDASNTLNIFNDLEVDEIIILDIFATQNQALPQFDLIEKLASECFMPLSYGGGVADLSSAKKIFELGIEKISLNTAAHDTPSLIGEIAKTYGSQSVIISIDVKRNLWRKPQVFINRGKTNTNIDPVTYAKKAEQEGAGELLITSIDKEGTFKGYDVELIGSISNAVNIPVIANGGAGCLDDLASAVNIGGASAVSLGSLVVYQGISKSVLINFPEKETLNNLFHLGHK